MCYLFLFFVFASDQTKKIKNKKYCLFSEMCKLSIASIQHWTTMWNKANVMLVSTNEHWSLDMFGLKMKKLPVILIIKKLNFRFKIIFITPLLCCTTEAISWRPLKFSPLMEPNFMMWSPTFKPYNMKRYDRGKVTSLYSSVFASRLSGLSLSPGQGFYVGANTSMDPSRTEQKYS